MKEYRFSEEKAKEIVKKQILSSVPLYLICAFAGLYIANSRNDGQIFGNPIVLAVTIPLCFGALTLGLFLAWKKGPKALMQIIYQYSDREIVQRTASGKEVSIPFENIDTHKLSKRGLQIKSANKKILILAQLDDFNELSNSILKRIHE